MEDHDTTSTLVKVHIVASSSAPNFDLLAVTSTPPSDVEDV